MKWQAYTAELVGAFLLSLGVQLSLAQGFPVATPIVAGLVLGLMVYAIGPISGAHINPAVTISLASVKAIEWEEALYYVLAQLFGGILAYFLGHLMTGGAPTVTVSNAYSVLFAEALGAAVLVFGVSSVVNKKTPHDAAGLVIGGSLTLGVLLALPLSNGILNPAVAVALGSTSPMYILGPVIGGLLSAQLYKWLCTEKKMA